MGQDGSEGKDGLVADFAGLWRRHGREIVDDNSLDHALVLR